MKEWVRRGREGGREVEGEAYTSDTLLMKPLTAKQRRKQQERKKSLETLRQAEEHARQQSDGRSKNTRVDKIYNFKKKAALVL